MQSSKKQQQQLQNLWHAFYNEAFLCFFLFIFLAPFALWQTISCQVPRIVTFPSSKYGEKKQKNFNKNAHNFVTWPQEQHQQTRGDAKVEAISTTTTYKKRILLLCQRRSLARAENACTSV